MNAKIRKTLATRKRRIEQRLDKTRFRGTCPMIGASNIDYEIAQRTRAISVGGIGMMHQIVKRLQLDRAINQAVPIFKIYLPYSESDHVLNIAYNPLAGGTCLEHLELLRTNEVYLDALGATRIPDPTTAGDFCRRFSRQAIQRLMNVVNETRLKVWGQQSPEFLKEATIDADGTMVETTGECKEGIDINHKGQWGYHPRVLGQHAEPLFLSIARQPPQPYEPWYLDRAVDSAVGPAFARSLRGYRLHADRAFGSLGRAGVLRIARWLEGGTATPGNDCDARQSTKIRATAHVRIM